MARRSSSATPPPPALERIAAALGALVAIGLVGYLGWDALGSSTPPDIAVTAGAPYAANGGQTLPIIVVNRGGETAADVTVEGVLEGAEGGEPETREITFDFIPGQSERAGAMVFSRPPDTVSLQVTGYRKP